MDMQPHQQRVVDEHKELAERLTKLDAFIGTPKFAELHDYERTLLKNQAHYMHCYRQTLATRIALFNHLPPE